jgi:hypothetical protein
MDIRVSLDERIFSESHRGARGKRPSRRAAKKADELAPWNIDCHATHRPIMLAQWRDNNT